MLNDGLSAPLLSLSFLVALKKRYLRIKLFTWIGLNGKIKSNASKNTARGGRREKIRGDSVIIQQQKL